MFNFMNKKNHCLFFNWFLKREKKILWIDCKEQSGAAGRYPPLPPPPRYPQLSLGWYFSLYYRSQACPHGSLPGLTGPAVMSHSSTFTAWPPPETTSRKSLLVSLSLSYSKHLFRTDLFTCSLFSNDFSFLYQCLSHINVVTLCLLTEPRGERGDK